MEDDIYFSFNLYTKEFRDNLEAQYRSDSGLKRYLKRGFNVCASQWAELRKKQNGSEIKVLFCSDRFIYLLKGLAEFFEVTLLGANINDNLNACIKNNIPFFFTHEWNYKLYQSYFDQKTEAGSVVLSEIKRFITKGQYNIVILSNDFTVMERAIAVAAKSLKIPVVIIQHAYLCDAVDFNNTLPSGIMTDYYWFWDDYEKEGYEKYISQSQYFTGKKISLKTIGYPYEICKAPAEKFGVLFIGTSLDDQSESHWDKYYQMVDQVFQVCCELGIPFCYRFHPLQKHEYLRDKYRDNCNFLFSKESKVHKDLLKYEVIVGDISTVLMEAALLDRIVIQVLWEARTYTLYKNHNIAYRVENKYQDLYNLLTRAAERKLVPLPINDYYLRVNKCIIQDAVQEIKTILNQ